MAEQIGNPSNKRKNRSSSSGGSCNSHGSPDAKKSNYTGDFHRAEGEATYIREEEDEVLIALSMSEEIHQKLQQILKKLEKLSTIEVTVNNLQTSLADMSAKIQTLESSHASAKQEITDLKTKQAAALKDCEGINASLSQFHTKKKTINAKLKELESKCLYMETYSRRENIKFEDIEEEADTEDTEAVLRPFLSKELGYHDAESVEIQPVHRLGKKRDGQKPRAILARFLRYKDCEKILSLGPRLRESEFRIYQDLPYEIVHVMVF